MRRMYTTEGIQKIIDDSIDETFENLDDRKGVFEKIADKDGHLRFIEGTLDINPIQGVTYNYRKWSLSGSHIMFVVSGIIASGTTISNAEVITGVELPQWLMNKIYPCGIGNIKDIISYNDYNLVGINTYSRSNQQFYITKVEEANKIFINKSGSFTANEDTYFRIQFDLLIDNA